MAEQISEAEADVSLMTSKRSMLHVDQINEVFVCIIELKLQHDSKRGFSRTSGR